MVKEQALNEWLSAARNAEDRGQQFVAWPQTARLSAVSLPPRSR
jgi:hypothetical protein